MGIESVGRKLPVILANAGIHEHRAGPVLADLCSCIPASAGITIKINTPRTDPPRPCRHRCTSLRSEEHTSELQSLMRISYAVFCLKKKKNKRRTTIQQKSK